MSNYPDGVSGNEPELAGYPEREECIECPECGRDDYVTVSIHERAYTIFWDCPDCGAHIEIDDPTMNGPDE